MHFIFCSALSLLLTEASRRAAVKKGLFDNPNERSSHQVPTPRTGGLGVFAAFAMAVLSLSDGGLFQSPVGILLGGAVALFAAGFLDDLRPVPAGARLFVHVCSVGFLLKGLGGPVWASEAGPLVFWGMQAVALLWGVWVINVFNFMDGIDGLAASEAIFVGVFGGIFYYFGGRTEVAEVLWALAAAFLGFALLNWPPAKIFLGDGGSGMLGFIVAGVILTAASAGNSRLFWAILLLPSAFIADATVTLLVRIIRKQKWRQAHRSHAYQHAAARWGHRRTTLGIILVNVVWVLPWSSCVWYAPEYGPLIYLAAVMPLLLASFLLGGGVEIQRSVSRRAIQSGPASATETGPTVLDAPPAA